MRKRLAAFLRKIAHRLDGKKGFRAKAKVSEVKAPEITPVTPIVENPLTGSLIPPMLSQTETKDE